MTTIRSPAAARSHALLSAGVILGLGALLVLLHGHNPAAGGLFPPCPFRAATGGLLCPGCGSLRGLHQLLHGDLARAFSLNALMVLSLPLFVYLGIASLWSHRRRPAPGWTRPRHLAWITLAVICTWWVLRNIL
jgi:hypothetical protein